MKWLNSLLVLSLTLLALEATAQEECPITGDPCEHCGPGSVCSGKAGQSLCQCRGNLTGEHPDFNCYDHDKYDSCYMVQDPVVKSFSDLKGSFDFIGSTYLMDVITDYTEDPNGKCQFEIWGWTSKQRGKLYLAGLGFRQTITLADGTQHKVEGELTGRPDSWRHCRYEYSPYIWTNGRSPFAPGSKNTEAETRAFGESYVECGIEFTRTSKGHFMIGESACCGIEFGLRIHHSGYPDRVSGMYILTKKAANPVFDTSNAALSPLCLDAEQEIDFNDLIESTGISDKQAALTYQAITNSDVLDYYQAPPNLGQLKNSMRNCTLAKRNQLFQDGGFMFRNAHFINCAAADDEEYVDSLLYATQDICHDDTNSCQNLKSIIQANCSPQRQSKIPGLADYLAKSCS